MKIEEGQKKQLIVLCCLVALVIGFGIYRVVGTGTQAATPASDKPASQSGSSGQTPADAATAVNVPVVTTATVAARDPFTPQAVPNAKGVDVVMPRSTASTPPPILPSASTRQLPVIPPVSIRGPIQMDPVTPPAMQMPAMQMPMSDPTTELKVTGIIEGSINVAVIRGTNNTRYIVREGQLIDGKYRVYSISRSGVKVRYNGKSFELRLGGNNATQNGARA